VGKDLDSCPLDTNDPGGRCRISGIGDEAGVIGGAYQTEDEDTEDVEQKDTDPDTTNGNGDVLSRVLSFCGGHPENLSPQEGESRADQYRPETSETAQRARNPLVLNERTGVMPKAESEAVMGRSAAQINDETSDNEADDCDDLDRGEPELAFTKGAGAQKN